MLSDIQCSVRDGDEGSKQQCLVGAAMCGIGCDYDDQIVTLDGLDLDYHYHSFQLFSVHQS